MNIDPLKRQPQIPLQGVTRRVQPDSSRQRRETSGDAVLDNINRQGLVQQLKDMPEVRSEVVDLGRKLADDPAYPPDEVIDQLAQVIADMPMDWFDDLIGDFDATSEQ